MAKTPEGYVKDAIKKWLEEHYPTAYTFMPVQHGYGQRGAPDFIVCTPMKITPEMVGQTLGIFVGIEAKTASGKQTPLQKIAETDINNAGGFYLIPYGSDDVEATLSELSYFAQKDI